VTISNYHFGEFMFKRKNIIEFCASDQAKGIPEIYPAYKKFPDWFLKSKKPSSGKSKCPFAPIMNLNPLGNRSAISAGENPYSLIKDSTVHHCPGIVDYLKTGYVLPAWTDMCFRIINGEMRFEAALETPEINYSVHRFNQFQGMSYEQKPKMGMFHKVSSPWWIKTSPGVSVLITDPYWNRNKNFTSVSAVVHPDITPIHLKWFFEFNYAIQDSPEIYDQKKQVVLKDTPLMLIIPFKRTSFNHEINYLSEQKLSEIHRDNYYGSISWFTDTIYNKFRKRLNNFYK
jgi:hypothetical protein